MEFTKEEKEMLIIALQIRRNIITTGTPHLSLADCCNMSAETLKMAGAEIKPLGDDQIELVYKTNQLIQKLINE